LPTGWRGVARFGFTPRIRRKKATRNALLVPEELKRLPLSFAAAVAASSAVVLAEAGNGTKH
jgi:hypothetical protein